MVPISSPEPAKVVDLMAALEASVAEAKEARTRHPTARGRPSGDEGSSTASSSGKRATAKAPATKKAAKKAAKKAPAKKKRSA